MIQHQHLHLLDLESVSIPPRLVGQDQTVPLVTGGWRRHVNFDYAASTPPLEEVAETLERFLPWYSSVHRGAGYKSQVSTAAYEQARKIIREFFGARHDDTLVFTRHTTEAINLLASCLPADARVLCTAVEHHANLLPWRRAQVSSLPVPESAAALLSSLEAALQSATVPFALVAVTGASNVTGEIWPIAEIARIAHRYGARLLVDAAQLAPHAPIDLAALEVDYLAVSGHKLYAPYGVGALIGRADWLAAAEPVIVGGGAVTRVTLDEVEWKPLPDRHEAGTPNLLGVIALAAACRTLNAYGMETVAAEEANLYRLAHQRLSAIAGLDLYSVWDVTHPHIGVLAFNLRGYDHALLATILSAEYGISVRAGSFCAQPLVRHLLRDADREVRCESASVDDALPPQGAVRLSMGLATTVEDIEYLADALQRIASTGAEWHYSVDATTCQVRPTPETRAWPEVF